MLKKRQRKPDGNFYLRGTVRGQRIYESTETSDPDRAEEIRARREAELWDRAVRGGRGTRTFAEAVVIYLQLRQPGPSYRATLLRLLNQFENWPCAEIDQNAIDAYVHRHHANSAPGTVLKAVVTPMTAILRVAAKRGWCDLPAFDRPTIHDKPVRWLRPEEADRLLRAAAPHLRPLLVFLLHTGARLGEALRLEWSEVDMAARRATFLRTKNGESRGVPLNADALQALANLPHRDGHVFLTPAGTPYHDTRGLGGSPIKRAFRTACRRAGIAGLRVHDLRHSHASWLVMAGVPLRTVAELLGHRTLDMVQRYTHLAPAHLAGAVERIASGAETVQSPDAASQPIKDK